MKLNNKTITLGDHPQDYMVFLGFPFDRAMQEELKMRVPGASYAGKLRYGQWQAPVEMIPQVLEVAANYGLDVVDLRTQGTHFLPEIDEGKLFPFQVQAIQAALQDRSRIFAFDMGLGKTAAAITAMREAGVKTALIIAPASVRLQWADQLDEWWPEHPEVFVLEGSAKLKKATTPFISTSYGLAYHFKNQKFDAIIVDEAHAISNRKAARSKVVKEILTFNPDALRLFLTGTPIMNEVHQLWNQLEALFPKRFGTYGQFCERYCNIMNSDFSEWIPKGVDEHTAPELRDRLNVVCTRATKTEWGHLLDPFVLTPIRVRSKRKFKPRELLEEFSRMDAHNVAGMDNMIRGFASDKVKHAVDYVDTAMANVDHLVVLTHLKATGQEISALLREKLRGIEIFYMDGDVSVRKRNQTIENAKACEKAVLISTMHAVKEGINSLVAFDQALIAELYWSPGLMAQVLGRFERLNGSCNVGLMVVEGTHEELIAQALMDKMANSRQILSESGNERALADVLHDEVDLDEEFALMQEIVGERIDEAW